MKKRIFYILLFSVITPVSAWANAGLPMIVIAMPLMLSALIPIIGIEAYIIKRKLNLSFRDAMVSSATANVISTIIGVPITWGILYLMQISIALMLGGISSGYSGFTMGAFFQKFLTVIWESPWLLNSRDTYWMIPTAQLILLVPFFFSSWKIEYFVVKRINRQLQLRAINLTCFRANLITYLLLALVVIFVLIFRLCYGIY